jgi:Ni,Fe-hydrogenase III large subunit/Ni,Fe-hydrogenase III component G
MNKQLFCEELKKLNLNFEIKNNNEVYIETVQTDIKKITEILISKLKLRFVAEFCRQEEEFVVNIILRNKIQGYLVVLFYKTKNEVESLSEVIYQAGLFEREIADLFGLKIINSIDERKLVKHEFWEKDVYPLRKEFPHGEKISIKNEIPEYEFKPLFLDGGFQIAVGPVHAGIIEPGHFRFSVIGEEIENLELRFMYKHRGIEKLAENTAVDKLNLVFERVAGESSVAYGEAYALLVEKLMGIEVKRDIKALRTVLLELERAYNFLEDIAGICVDIGYSYPAKKLSYFAEEIHQLCERISGSRFLRNSIIPLGTNISFDKNKALDVVNTIKKIEKRMNKIVETTINSVSFLDRVENTGLVFNEKAKRLCLTGVVGRASGVVYDVRKSYPYELYKEIKKEVNVEEIGGVFERYKLKINEIKDAFVFVKKAIEMIDKDIVKEKAEIVLENGQEALAIVESVKGELVVYGRVGENNRFSRIYFKTPSFANWNGLTLAVLGEIVPDFPLCNKSFNMSYSENDR